MNAVHESLVHIFMEDHSADLATANEMADRALEVMEMMK